VSGPRNAAASGASAVVEGALSTFLFTDIAGSTRLWEDHAAAMGAALAQHDALLRASIEGHGAA
jgi:class 3 adenylate cyclase